LSADDFRGFAARGADTWEEAEERLCRKPAHNGFRVLGGAGHRSAYALRTVRS